MEVIVKALGTQVTQGGLLTLTFMPGLEQKAANFFIQMASNQGYFLLPEIGIDREKVRWITFTRKETMVTDMFRTLLASLRLVTKVGDISLEVSEIEPSPLDEEHRCSPGFTPQTDRLEMVLKDFLDERRKNIFILPSEGTWRERIKKEEN